MEFISWVIEVKRFQKSLKTFKRSCFGDTQNVWWILLYILLFLWDCIHFYKKLCGDIISWIVKSKRFQVQDWGIPIPISGEITLDRDSAKRNRLKSSSSNSTKHFKMEALEAFVIVVKSLAEILVSAQPIYFETKTDCMQDCMKSLATGNPDVSLASEFFAKLLQS